MKYISIDIETSGLDSDKHQILSFAAIIEDTKLKLPLNEIPKFSCIIKHNELIGSVFGLNMNKKIISLMNDHNESKNDESKTLLEVTSGYKFVDESSLAQEFYRFLAKHNFLNRRGEDMSEIQHINFSGATSPIVITVAGKNFGTFDKLFLEKLPWWKKLIFIRQRIIDPGVLFVDWIEDDALPSLTECKKRADIGGEVTHDALEDAWDVIELLRKKY